MLRKGLGCWVYFKNTINTRKGVKTIDGMTLGGAKATIVLRKKTYMLGLF